jgi:hypothetical protein
MWLPAYNDDSMMSFAEVDADLISRGVVDYLSEWYNRFFGFDGYVYNYINGLP